MHLAGVTTNRAMAFDAWLHKCKSKRYKMHALVNSVVFLTITCLAYSNLVFAARFDR